MSTIDIKANSAITKTDKIPKLRAAYALALIQAGQERVVTYHDQKRLLASRLVTLAKSGSLVLTVKGLGTLNGTN